MDARGDVPENANEQLEEIRQRMSSVKHKILVLSGKGGVGKSTFAAQLAFALAAQGKEVGLLDIDICGPSIPKMLGVEREEVHQSNVGWSPVYVEENLAIMSIGFLLPNPDEAVIWRGPRKNGLIKQFLKDVHWGELDYLVVDAPPGTSDEHITIAQCLRTAQADGAVIVTTPQEVSIIDVRKEINFCKKTGLRVLGVVENMSGLMQRVPAMRFVDHSGAMPCDATEQVLQHLRLAFPNVQALVAETPVFHASNGGAEKMCQDMRVPFLGKVPLDPSLGRAAEEGRSAFMDGAMLCLPYLNSIVQKVVAATAGIEGSNGVAAANGDHVASS